MNNRNTYNSAQRIIDDFFGGTWYLFAAVLISVPTYIAVHSYIDSIGVHEDEAVAFAATVCFILGAFAGRYLGRLWLLNSKNPSGMSVGGLAFFIVVCIIWTFFHADFPLGNRVAVNLMLFWIPFAMMSIATGVFFKVLHAISNRQLAEAQQDAAHSRSELHLLQSQLSPHFLFNTLNNLYGLSITNHEKMPPLLLKLSELLRYAVYDAREEYVPLTDELAYIRNYIAFEKLRIGERLKLNVEIEETVDPSLVIAPMLLIVFIENAFKHSKNSASNEIYIDIKLRTWGSSVLFLAKNSYSHEKNKLDHLSGVGLPNVTKRLQLLYPGAHDLQIKSDDTTYTVELQLKTKIK